MTGRRYNFAILRNESDRDHLSWVKACERYKDQVSYKIIDLTRNDWLKKLEQEQFDYCLVKPAGRTNIFKQLFDERINILVNDLGYKVFPSFQEILIYENKRYLAYWLEANKIPYPPTHIFYHKKEAQDYLKSCKFPVVGKLNIGASGKGVAIIRNKEDGFAYVEKIFGSGIASSTGPRLSKGKLFQRAWRKLTHPDELKERLSSYKAMANDPQKGFCLFQEFIEHEYEWRAVRIGDSFFAHKKMKLKEMASGTLVKGYDNPPPELLDFVKEVTDKYDFYSQAMDLFETPDGRYLVNEMQCIFGQSDPYQMLVDDEAGRYVMDGKKWVFEAGDFASNQCYDLRVKYVIDLLDNRS